MNKNTEYTALEYEKRITDSPAGRNLTGVLGDDPARAEDWNPGLTSDQATDLAADQNAGRKADQASNQTALKENSESVAAEGSKAAGTETAAQGEAGTAAGQGREPVARCFREKVRLPRNYKKAARKHLVWKSEYFDLLREELERQKGEDVDLSFRTVRKNNGIYRNACTVRCHNAQIAPTVYLDPYYDHYLHGEAVTESAENILNYCRRKTPDITFPEDFFKEFESVRGRLGVKLIGTQKNLELLRDVPHIEIEDMSAVFFYLLESPAFGNGMILVRNTDMERWGKTPQTLYEEAIENCIRMLPPVLKPLSDILEVIQPAGDGDLYLLTNESALYGAAVALYPGILQEASRCLGESFFVLPSSIHEMILLPDNGEDAKELLQIVKEINHTQVAEEEVLTDSVYKFRAGDTRFHKEA